MSIKSFNKTSAALTPMGVKGTIGPDKGKIGLGCGEVEISEDWVRIR